MYFGAWHAKTVYSSSSPVSSIHLNVKPFPSTVTMQSRSAELQRLAHYEYWDERYNEVGPDEQVHEWFRSFDDLHPFLDRHLFQVRRPETSPKILHLGSGDSVSPVVFELQ